MNPITQVEDTIIGYVKAAVGNKLRQIESIGGGWTMDSLKRSLQFAPGVYVSFQGATAGDNPDLADAKYVVYVVNKGTSDHNRRRGNQRVIGAYDILQRIIPYLANVTVEGVGTLKLLGINNLFREAMFDLGGTVYAIQMTLPNMDFSFQADLDDDNQFVDFTEWHAEHYRVDGIDADPSQDPLAIDEVHAP